MPHQLQIREHVRLSLAIQVSLLQTPKQLVIQCNFPIFMGELNAKQ